MPKRQTKQQEQKSRDAGRSAIQMDMFGPNSDWRPPSISDMPDWSRHKVIGIDVETKDPGIAQKLGPGVRRGGYITGVSLTFDGGRPYYLPYRHEGGDNVAEDEA